MSIFGKSTGKQQYDNIESINRIIYIIYLSRRVTQKLVLGSFDNIDFKKIFFAHRRYNDKLSFSNYLSLDILHGAYSFGDSIYSLELAFKTVSWPRPMTTKTLSKGRE